jgi:ABC-2 type transport system ATP-binding protein
MISSHLLSEIEQVASHVAIMSQGRVLAQGALTDVLGRDNARLQVGTTRPQPAKLVLERLGLSDARIDPDGIVRAELMQVDPVLVGPALVGADVPFSELRVVRPALEDLFVELTGAGFDVAG